MVNKKLLKESFKLMFNIICEWLINTVITKPLQSYD